MENINELLKQVPLEASDLASNLSTVLQSQFLSPEQIWSVALTSSFFVQHPALTTAVLADARGVIGEDGVEDARGAAAIMGMKHAISALQESLNTGLVVDRPDLCVSFEELNQLVGFDEITDMEKQFPRATGHAGASTEA